MHFKNIGLDKKATEKLSVDVDRKNLPVFPETLGWEIQFKANAGGDETGMGGDERVRLMQAAKTQIYMRLTNKTELRLHRSDGKHEPQRETQRPGES